MSKRKSGLTDDERASELAACADHDDSDYANDDWCAPPSIATKAERIGWHRHFVGMDAPDGGAQLVGWLAREIAIPDELRRREDPEAADVTTDDIHSPNCDVLTDAAFKCNCGDAPSSVDLLAADIAGHESTATIDCRDGDELKAAARLRDDIAATAAGEDPVVDRLVEELMADDEADAILPDEVAS